MGAQQFLIKKATLVDVLMSLLHWRSRNTHIQEIEINISFNRHAKDYPYQASIRFME